MSTSGLSQVVTEHGLGESARCGGDLNLTVSTEEAAAMLGMSVQSIRKLILHEHLYPVETPNARKYRVSLWSVLVYLGIPEAAVNSIFAQHLGQGACNVPLLPPVKSDRGASVHPLTIGQPISAGGMMPLPANLETVIRDTPLLPPPCPTSLPPRTGVPDRRVSAAMDRFDTAASRVKGAN